MLNVSVGQYFYVSWEQECHFTVKYQRTSENRAEKVPNTSKTFEQNYYK